MIDQYLSNISFYRFSALLIFLIATGASCGNNNKSIEVKGSDTEVNLAVDLAERFYAVDQDFSIAISGGGSGLGIASLLNRQADIANSSRPLNEEEDSLFKSRKIILRTVIFAEDATAFIVQKNFPLDSIDVPSLTGVLSGLYKNWKDVGGRDLPINIYGRQSNSGTHSFIRKKLHIQFSRDAKELNGNGQIIEGVKMDASGIGYVGVGYILHNGEGQPLKVLKIAEKTGQPAVSPLDKAAILARRYYFQRPLYQFIPAASWEKVSAFIDFEKGPGGVKIIQAAGYYVIKPK